MNPENILGKLRKNFRDPLKTFRLKKNCRNILGKFIQILREILENFDEIRMYFKIIESCDVDNVGFGDTQPLSAHKKIPGFFGLNLKTLNKNFLFLVKISCILTVKYNTFYKKKHSPHPFSPLPPLSPSKKF